MWKLQIRPAEETQKMPIGLFSHFRVRKAEDSNSSVKELTLQPLSMVVPISQHCCGLIYVEFSTYTSSKDTHLSLQILIEYYETKRRYPNAYFVT